MEQAQGNTAKKKNTKSEVDCKKQEKSILNDKEIHVKVENPKIVDSVDHLTNYVLYEVNTPEANWSVERRHFDFIWLKECLFKLYPGKYFYNLPKEGIRANMLEEKHIEKKRFYLQKFMDTLISDEEVKASEPFIIFLSMTDRTEFDKKVQEFENFKPSPYVEELRSLSGKVTVIDNMEEYEKYISNINKFSKIQNDIFEKLHSCFKNFFESVNEVEKNLDEIQRCFNVAYTLTERVLLPPKITGTYQKLDDFFKVLKKVVSDVNKNVDNNLKSFFKTKMIEDSSFNLLTKTRENLKVKYEEEKKKLDEKKEKLWEEKKVDNWEIVDDSNQVDKAKLLEDKDYALSQMCTNETKKLESRWKHLSCVSNNLFIDLKKNLKTDAPQYIENLKHFCDDFDSSIKEIKEAHEKLNNFATSF